MRRYDEFADVAPVHAHEMHGAIDRDAGRCAPRYGGAGR